MKKLPLGIQTFDEIIREGYIYIDKTKYIFNLINLGKSYFLGRPRRFGKSLLISTMEAIFKGRKELFKDLAITKLGYDFKEYPIIRIDFSRMESKSIETFVQTLKGVLGDIYEKYDLPNLVDKELTVKRLFELLIEGLYKKHNERVVILIDEYDKPILNNFGADTKLAQDIREELRSFYSIIKANDASIKFFFLTGVTKFAKMSIFSELNNLSDISTDNRYTKIVGFTQDEIQENFNDRVEDISKHLKISYTETLGKIRSWYNGYRFSKILDRVYNPFSTLHCLDKRDFKNYWIDSGMPYFIARLLKEREVNIERIREEEYGEFVFAPTGTEDVSMVSFLYQAGYLTISDYEEVSDTYKFDYPNKEVALSMNLENSAVLLDLKIEDVGVSVKRLANAVRKDDMESFIKYFESFWLRYNHHQNIKNHDVLSTSIYTMLQAAGLDAEGEVDTSTGRIDILIRAKQRVYIIELKIVDKKTKDESSKAIKQIYEKEYIKKYIAEGFLVTLLGISFSTEKRNINGYKIELPETVKKKVLEKPKVKKATKKSVKKTKKKLVSKK